MKILHFCMGAPFTEGYSYQDNLLTEYQQKLGHIVRIVTSTRTRGDNGHIITADVGLKKLSNGVELVRIKFLNKVSQLLGVYSGIYKQIKEFNPDMVFIHGLCSFIPASVIRYKNKCNKNLCIVADNHQDVFTTKVKGFPFSLVLNIHSVFWKKWIKNIDKVYGTTSWRVSFAKKYYNIPADKVDTLIMGIDPEKIPVRDSKSIELIRADLGFSCDEFVFITGGKLDKNKKTIEAMRAFKRLDAENALFLIFGSVADEIKDDFYKILESDKRIRYIGYIPSNDASKYFSVANFGVFPGRHSVLWEEAIGCSLPCLFKKYESKDHMEVCNNCVSFFDNDEDTVFEVMKKVIDDKDYYDELRMNSEKAAEKFSYYDIAKKSLECLSD